MASASSLAPTLTRPLPSSQEKTEGDRASRSRSAMVAQGLDLEFHPHLRRRGRVCGRRRGCLQRASSPPTPPPPASSPPTPGSLPSILVGIHSNRRPTHSSSPPPTTGARAPGQRVAEKGSACISPPLSPSPLHHALHCLGPPHAPAAVDPTSRRPLASPPPPDSSRSAPPAAVRFIRSDWLRSPLAAMMGMDAPAAADVLAALVPSWSAAVVLASYLAYLAAAGALLPGKLVAGAVLPDSSRLHYRCNGLLSLLLLLGLSALGIYMGWMTPTKCVTYTLKNFIVVRAQSGDLYLEVWKRRR